MPLVAAFNKLSSDKQRVSPGWRSFTSRRRDDGAPRRPTAAEKCMLARMESAASPASAAEPFEEVSDTERAVYGAVTPVELRTFLDAWARDRLGSRIADVRFRAGRIDAVWGVGLQDGRAVVIKAHRTPVDRRPGHHRRSARAGCSRLSLPSSAVGT